MSYSSSQSSYQHLENILSLSSMNTWNKHRNITPILVIT